MAEISKAKYIAKLGILLALAVVLQFLEGLIPIPLPLGVKPGISSVVIMYILIFWGFRASLTTAFLKSCFVFITRGATAFCMSLCGGILSLIMMWAVLLIYQRKKDDVGLIVISVTGGIFHNIGQLIAASIISKTFYTISYLPVLIIAGIIAGAFTGILLKIFIPYAEKLSQ